MLPLASQDTMNEIDIDEIIELLDLSLSSSLPGNVPWMVSAALNYGFSPAALIGDPQSQPVSLITKQQLRALKKEHLLVMLRDAEKELYLEKEKNEYLLHLHQAAHPRRE